MSQTVKNSESWASSYQTEMILAIQSFICAQKGYQPFSKEVKKILSKIIQSPFEDFNYKIYGIVIRAEYEYAGYERLSDAGVLLPEDKKENNYSFSFHMYKDSEGNHGV